MQDDPSEWTPGRAQFWDEFYSEDGGRLQQKDFQCRRSEDTRHGRSLMDHYEWFMPYALYDDALQHCLNDCLTDTSNCCGRRSSCNGDDCINEGTDSRRARRRRPACQDVDTAAFRVLHIGCGNSDFVDHFRTAPMTASSASAHAKPSSSSARTVEVLNVDICADLIARLTRTFPHRCYAVGDVCALVNPDARHSAKQGGSLGDLWLEKTSCRKSCACAGWYVMDRHAYCDGHGAGAHGDDAEGCAARLLHVVPHSVDLVFDKGTADALLSGFPGEVNPNFAACAREALRVLRTGGVYVCISINSSDTLSPYFLSASADVESVTTENTSRFFQLRHQSVIQLDKSDVSEPRVETLGLRYSCFGYMVVDR